MPGNQKCLFVVLITVILCFLPLASLASAPDLCMGCHGDKSLQGTPLYINPDKYRLTAHSQIGCESCHLQLTADHPQDGKRSVRASCDSCHAPIAEELNKDAHSRYASCTDCHNPHTARSLKDLAAQDINLQCIKCHDLPQMNKLHKRWLPQSRLHLETLPCITCHTASENYVIALYLHSRGKSPFAQNRQIHPASWEELNPLFPGADDWKKIIDANSDGTISPAELNQFVSLAGRHGLSLLGTMMPEKVTHSFKFFENRRDCTFCHASGPKVDQASFLVVPTREGGYERLPVAGGAITDILFGTPDFYMVGFMRSRTLSYIGLIIVIAGLMVPIFHGSIRFWTRRKRKDGTHV